MKSLRCFILMVVLSITMLSGCVVSIRAPVEEAHEMVELMICDSVMIGGHEILCKDISIFNTSAILSIDGRDVLVKDLGPVELPCGIDDIEMEVVAFTHNDGISSIEIVYRVD